MFVHPHATPRLTSRSPGRPALAVPASPLAAALGLGAALVLALAIPAGATVATSALGASDRSPAPVGAAERRPSADGNQDAPSAGGGAIYLPLALGAGTLADLPLPPSVVPTRTAPPSATPTATDEPPTAEPPTATPVPPTATDEPTAEPPTAVPSPTATEAPQLACRELLTNGDFEAGARSWSLIVTDTEQQVSRAIEHRSRVNLAPFGGDWLAWLGGLDQSTFKLTSDRLASYDPDEVVSATLSMGLAVVTEETHDRRANDRLMVYAHTPGRQAIPGASFSEESVTADYAWAPVRVDATRLLAERRASALELEVRLDGARRTWFYVDEISLSVCAAATP